MSGQADREGGDREREREREREGGGREGGSFKAVGFFNWSTKVCLGSIYKAYTNTTVFSGLHTEQPEMQTLKKLIYII